MPEIGTSGSMSENGKRSVAKWPKLPRSFSTLPKPLRVRKVATRKSPFVRSLKANAYKFIFDVPFLVASRYGSILL